MNNENYLVAEKINNMVILGIDPGINCTGWAVIETGRNQALYIDSGYITTNISDSLELRLAKICSEIGIVIDRFIPMMAAMEEIFVNKNFQSSLKLSHARGAIMATIGLKSIPLCEFAPNYIKKTVVGVGRAEKSQIQRMVTLLVKGAKFSKVDEADALAIAYTCSVAKSFSVKSLSAAM